jgi:hypothetical protein
MKSGLRDSCAGARAATICAPRADADQISVPLSP